MVCSQGRRVWKGVWAGLVSTALFAGPAALGQVVCVKPDAGPDISSSGASVKLKDAPEGYFWSAPSGNPTNTVTIHAQTGQITGLSTPGNYRFVLSSINQSLNSHAAGTLPQDGSVQSKTLSGKAFLDNGIIKVGVDSQYGGSITHLSAKNGLNLINNYDRGRQAQIGIYGGPNPFLPPGVEYNYPWRGIGWNPIQAGDSYDNVSAVLAYEKRDNLIYVKTRPKHWPLRNYDGTSSVSGKNEVEIEHWIRLVGNVVKVRARITLNRADTKFYSARDQEFPCLYLNSSLRKSWTYLGDKPFTNETVSTKLSPFGMTTPRVTEPWIAFTREDNFGVGLYAPNNFFYKDAFFGNPGSDNEYGADASYMAATPFAQLDHNSVTDFDYELVVGHINDIRSYVYSQPRPDKGPNYRFTNSRLGWYFAEGVDTGFPIVNQINQQLTGVGEQQLKSPAVYWKGRDNPKLYVRAAFDLKTGPSTYRIHWQNSEDYDFLGLSERAKDFPIINDGQFHTYEIDMTSSSWMNSNIRQIMFRPSQAWPVVTGSFKLAWFSNDPNGPPMPPAEAGSVVCTDTVIVNVAPAQTNATLPNAGPDLALRCGVSAVNLTTPATGLSWRILSKPTGSLATVTTQGAARNLQVPGSYLLTLSNDVTRTVDIMAINVPACSAPQTLSSVVYLDNGSRGGVARNGKQEPGEPGIPNVHLTLYSDPNGDGNPEDGQILEQATTNSLGQYSFTKLYTNEFYLIGLDAVNFDQGQPLWKIISSRQANFTRAYGLLSPRVILPGTTDAKARVKVDDADPSFGLVPDCQQPTCLTIGVKRLSGPPRP